jgi:hypothetical protein
MKRALKALLGASVLAITAADIEATTVRRVANEELAREADLIVIGRAVESKPVWVDRTLATLVTVRVDETLKGPADAQVTVALPGGIDASRKFPVAVSYPGAPTMSPDEDVVLFLVAGENVGSYAVAGFSQGKFSIVEDSEGAKLVSRDLTDVQVQDTKGVSRGTRTLQRLTDFVAEIRDHVRGER